MKIVSFNVNGLRAILQKEFIKDFKYLDADIFSLNETKLSEEAALLFPFNPEGYYVYHTESVGKKGYSGVAVFTRNKPLSVYYGLKEHKYDEEGRVITLEFDNFYYVACYVPNAGDGLKRLDFRMEFEDNLKEYLSELDSKKPVVYAGDLNVAHKPIDLKNPKSNEHNPGYTIEERTKFQELLDKGFTDCYRYLYPENIKYTWWSYRFKARDKDIGWRIDYFICSNSIKDKIEDVIIHNEVYGSDHCPIELKINL